MDNCLKGLKVYMSASEHLEVRGPSTKGNKHHRDQRDVRLLFFFSHKYHLKSTARGNSLFVWPMP